MKYLFDENCSVSDKFLNEYPGCQNVKYHISKGVTDDTILQNINISEFVIVTKDITFALNALIAGFKIVYRDNKTKDNFLQITELHDSFINEFKKLRI